MKTYIKNIEGLNDYLGYENSEFHGEEIGYGEKAIIFNVITDLCKDFEDFCVNAEIGQAIEIDGKMICKVINSQGDAENIYEDENGEIHSY